MADDQENTTPIVPPMKSNSGIKEYRCPHCEKFLFKGAVQKLNLVCHHCQKMIDLDESELLEFDEDND